MNVTLGKYVGKEVHPRLVPVLCLVFAKQPQLEFVGTGAPAFGALADKVTDFDVYHGHDKIGSIELLYTGYRGSTQYVFAVSHGDIRNARGPQGIKRTINPKQAVKMVLDFFKPAPVDRVVREILDDMRATVHSAGYGAKSEIDNLTSRHQFKTYMLYEHMLAFVRGEVAADALPTKVHEMFTDDEVASAIDKRRVAASVYDAFNNHCGIVIRMERKDVFRVVDLRDKSIKVMESTYDLPTHYQEKFAMLKLFDNKTPIESVGIKSERLEQPLYFLIDGATVTTC